MNGLPRYTLLTMGIPHQPSVAAWHADSRIGGEVRLVSATPSGDRFGKRILGLGVDSARVATKAVVTRSSGPFLCANPWTAVALRAMGVSNLAVTGIYALPGTRSWRILRRAIGTRPVVTLVEAESRSWNAEGGRSVSVRYGNTFGYRPAVDFPKSAGRVRVFIGGSSDRDPAQLERLIGELATTSTPVDLVIADGSGPSREQHGDATVERLPRIPPERFGEVLATCHVVFLPLANRERAAGHMVTVGALEAGLRVLATPARGMTGYIDGDVVRTTDGARSLSEQLDRIGRRHDAADSVVVREFWRENYSIEAYVGRVMDAVTSLSEMPAST